MPEYLLPLLPVILIVLVLVVIVMLGYVKAPPDQAYIISGLKKREQGPHRPGRDPRSVPGAPG